jgi:hypothetical protein
VSTTDPGSTEQTSSGSPAPERTTGDDDGASDTRPRPSQEFLDSHNRLDRAIHGTEAIGVSEDHYWDETDTSGDTLSQIQDMLTDAVPGPRPERGSHRTQRTGQRGA